MHTSAQASLSSLHCRPSAHRWFRIHATSQDETPRSPSHPRDSEADAPEGLGGVEEAYTA
eukprot:10456427-Alexandrium_andersonii.AAC.1